MLFDIKVANEDGHNMIIIKPYDNMTDEMYNSVKHKVEALNAHWREKYKGFVIYTDIIKKSEEQLWRENMQFYPTPSSVAKRVVELSGIHGHIGDSLSILEPSAGDGSLLKKLPISRKHSYTVIEPMKQNIVKLKDLNFIPYEGTFEKYIESYPDSRFTHIIMNPPFSHSRDIKHVMMAYNMLSEGGRLVAIVSENSLYYENEYSEKFRQWVKDTEAAIEPVAPGSFWESGTMVDTVIITVNKGR